MLRVLSFICVCVCSVMSDSLRPQGLQHTGLSCFTVSQSLLKLMSIESLMTSNNLIFCHPPSPALNISQHQGLFPEGKKSNGKLGGR